MGAKLAEPAGDELKIEVKVDASMPISKIELCRSNGFIDVRTPEQRRAAATFVDSRPRPGRSYYYVRVTLVDEELAWSSPVWFRVDGSHSHERP